MAWDNSTVAVSSMDAAAVETIKHVLAAQAEPCFSCRHVSELAARLSRTSASVAIVDIDADPERILHELESIVARFAATRFVVLSTSRDDSSLLAAMQVGVRHFLLKQTLAADLESALTKLRQHSGGAKTGGTVVTVLSASGGCGATTLGVNLANELSLGGTGLTLMVDMDCCYGSCATYLGVEGQYSLADVLARGNHVIDADLIRSSSIAHTDKLHLLMSPSSVNFSSPKPLNYESVPAVLEACRRAYAFTVIDAPRVSMDTAAALAHASQTTLIVFQLMIKDIRTVLSMTAALRERGVSLDTIRPIANRYRKRTPTITAQEGQKALGDMRLECTSNDFAATLKSLNYGQPLAKIAPRSEFRRELMRLASDISQGVAASTRGPA